MITTASIHSFGRRLLVLAVMMMAGFGMLYAQTEGVAGETTEDSAVSPLDTIPEDARALFNRFVQQPDTATAQTLAKYRSDRFHKRLSFHTNIVDWATLVPNIGIEFDLSGNTRTQYSISLHGKYNGGSSAGRTVYNVNALRLEGRKYWRTGKYGKAKEYYKDFVALCTDTASPYFNADTLAQSYIYVDDIGFRARSLGVRMESMRVTDDMTQAERDSLDFTEDSLAIKQRRFRRWVYNTYHKFRRNVTSGRTLSNPRNWRAYYFGVWAGMDNWSISLSGKGKQGQGIGLGILGGYTLPLFPQKYPREGSLDLDLGLAIGWKAVKYDAYNFEEVTRHQVYNPAASQKSFKVIPYPVIQDLHVSLVWRFRGIKNKADLSLVDDFDKYLSEYNDRKNKAETHSTNISSRRKLIEEMIANRTLVMADSSSFWDGFNRRRLEVAMRLNPDTVFSGTDLQDYLRIIKGIPVKDQEKYLHNQEIEKTKATEEAERLQRKKERELQDSLMDAQKDSLKNVRKVADKKEKESARNKKKKEKEQDSVEQPDGGDVPAAEAIEDNKEKEQEDTESPKESESKDEPEENPDTQEQPEGSESPDTSEGHEKPDSPEDEEPNEPSGPSESEVPAETTESEEPAKQEESTEPRDTGISLEKTTIRLTINEHHVV